MSKDSVIFNKQLYYFYVLQLFVEKKVQAPNLYLFIFSENDNVIFNIF